MTRASRKTPLMIAGVLAVCVMVLGALAIDLSRKTPLRVANPVAVTVSPLPSNHPSAPVAAPTAAEESDDDLLVGLTPRAKKAAVARKRAPKADVAVNADPATPTQPEQGGADFRFLEEEQDLKRPTF